MGLSATAWTRRPTAEIVVALLRFRRVDATQRRAEVAHVVMADTHQRKAGQIAVGDELIELALPFVITPQIGIVLVITAEIHIGRGSEARIERSDLNDACANGSVTGLALVPMLPMLFTRKP